MDRLVRGSGGCEVPLLGRAIGTLYQHCGLGKWLLGEAESRDGYGAKSLSVLRGVGVKSSYWSLGLVDACVYLRESF